MYYIKGQGKILFCDVKDNEIVFLINAGGQKYFETVNLLEID
jgi:hypothetical protein